MRNVDNKDVRKHIDKMNSIKPICRSKLVRKVTDNTVTMRFLIDWKWSKIRAGLVVGGLFDGEPHLSETGMMCIEQWMDSHPNQEIVFAEFKHTATGNIERLKNLLASRLDEMKKIDNAVILLVAKNSTMYDKLFMLLGLFVTFS